MTSADFAAAQQRVSARRRTREAAIQARLARQQGVGTSAALDRLSLPFGGAWSVLRSQWESISGRVGNKPAFRVGQVDAELLDEELLELLKAQVGEALKYYDHHLLDEWSAEILLALRAVLFKLSIWDHDASYGAALQNLRYTDARDEFITHSPPKSMQKVLYGIFSVGGRYAWTKWEDYLLDAESGYEEPSQIIRTLLRLSSLVSTTHDLAAFASLLIFLSNGRYRTILDRVLRLRLAPTTNQVSREVSFEYLNRQLVWHAFTEFLLFLLPLVGISRWRRWVARAWRKTKLLFRRSVEDDDGNVGVGGEFNFLPERTCAICYQDQNPISASENEVVAIPGASSGVIGSAQMDITNPYETIPCGCKYCFICLAQRLEAEDGEGWSCLRCGEVIRECKPWSGDVVEATSRPSSRKSVAFAEDDKQPTSLKNRDPMPVEDERSSAH